MTHVTRISRLTVGELAMNNVEASIVPALGDQHALLGMSFLHAFDLEQRGKELVIRERAR
jgi:predicted aspartyl protease